MYGRRRVANISGTRWLLILALVSATLAARGDELPGTVTIGSDEPVRVRSLSSTVQLLEDPQGSLDIQKVSRAPADLGFVAATPDSANVGFSASAWWVRFTLRNSGDQQRLVYLRQDYPLIDSLTLYEPKPSRA